MSDFVEYLHEVFQSLGPITTRKMFGGHGIYHSGSMFGLVADDVLYLKADAESIPAFEAFDLAPFVYIKNGKPMSMSYYEAPPRIYEDETEALQWASIAYAAALRAKFPKRRRKQS